MKVNRLGRLAKACVDASFKEVIAAMPKFDTFDEFAAYVLPEPRFNADHRALLKAFFTFQDRGVFYITADMLFKIMLGTDNIKVTNVQQEFIHKLVPDILYKAGRLTGDQMRIGEGRILDVSKVTVRCDVEEVIVYVAEESLLYQYYQNAVVHKEEQTVADIVQDSVLYQRHQDIIAYIEDLRR